jgi:zinc transporter, ZIP family
MPPLNIMILAGLAGLATLIGVLLGSLLKKTEENIIFSASFAASLMILISVLELVPGAAKNISVTELLFWVSLGAFGVWFANLIIPHLHSVREIKKHGDKSLARLSYLIVVGMILHDFPEGFAIPSSFGYSGSLGFLVVAATFIHNIPEGYIMTLAPVKSVGRSFYYKSALLSALASLSGAGLGIALTAKYHNFNPIFLAAAAGAMLFIAIHELLPASYKLHHIKKALLGSATALAVYLILSFI